MMFTIQRIDGKDIELICRAESEFWASTIRDLLDEMDEDGYFVAAKENAWTKKLFQKDEEDEDVRNP